MTHHEEHEYESELLTILATELPDRFDLADKALRARGLEVLREAYHASSPKDRSRLRKAAALTPAPAGSDPQVPDWLTDLLQRQLGLTGLRQRAIELATAPAALELERWLADPPTDPTEAQLAAGARHALGTATDHDLKTIDAHLGHRSTTMPETFDFDPRALPPGANAKQIEAARRDLIKNLLGAAATKPVVTFILGALSLDGRLLDPDPSAIKAHILTLRNETEGSSDSIVRDASGQPKTLTNVDALDKISRAVTRVRGGDNEPSYYEEFAFAARQLIANARNVPVDASGLEGRVVSSLTEYVPGQFGGSLALPDFESPAVAGSDLVGDNIRAVALVYAAWNLEELKLFEVLDRVVEVFMNGQLPVGFDNGGRALANYYFSDDETKLTVAARRLTFTRVLGAAGGEVSREAPPNSSFHDLFLRFLSSVSEFDRQRRIADVVAGGRSYDSLSLTAEQVRKSGRDLAANMTLYGYGGTFFVAQRLKDQISRALGILSTPEILAAYGVQSPFQVIERVTASDLGGVVPNITQRKTMAEAGKAILDIIADTLPAWQGGSRNPLFTPRADETSLAGLAAASGRTIDEIQPDIPPHVEGLLMRNTEHWLAVNGIKDEQRARLGEPELTAAAPSIPRAGAGDSGAAFDQLRALVGTGQAPSLDQLKALLPDMAIAPR